MSVFFYFWVFDFRMMVLLRMLWFPLLGAKNISGEYEGFRFLKSKSSACEVAQLAGGHGWSPFLFEGIGGWCGGHRINH